MDPVLRAALSSWDLRAEVILVLALAGAIYTVGWWRLRGRRRSRLKQNRWRAGAGWRPLAYIGGLILLAIALLSPIDVLASQLLIMHMIQHLLLVMIAPPLLLLANPFPFLLWGLPGGLRRDIGHLFREESAFRQGLCKITSPGLVLMVFVIFYWGWHDPTIYNLALENAFVHDLEHITFFVSSTLFWWHVVGAGPRIHRPLNPFMRVAYVLAAVPPNMFAGVAIAFTGEPIYTYYEAMPRLWGISVMNDQRIAGIIMWIPGSMMYIIAALILVARWLGREQKKPPLPKPARPANGVLTAPD